MTRKVLQNTETCLRKWLDPYWSYGRTSSQNVLFHENVLFCETTVYPIARLDKTGIVFVLDPRFSKFQRMTQALDAVNDVLTTYRIIPHIHLSHVLDSFTFVDDNVREFEDYLEHLNGKIKRARSRRDLWRKEYDRTLSNYRQFLRLHNMEEAA